MHSNKKHNPIVSELINRVRKRITSLLTKFCTLFYSEIPNKRELQQIAFNCSSYIDFKDYYSLQKMYCKTIFLCSN